MASDFESQIAALSLHKEALQLQAQQQDLSIQELRARKALVDIADARDKNNLRQEEITAALHAQE